MCDHCEAPAGMKCNPWDEDCPNFNPEESDTLPSDPFDAPSYQEENK